MASQTSGDCKIDIAVQKEEEQDQNGPQKSSPLGAIHMRRIPDTLKNSLRKFVRNAWKLGKDDPRRVIHAIKVGLALSVVSLFYLMEPLFDGVGDNAIWAVMTVVVVFEFTAGATLSKGLNRGFGTLVAGSLAISVGFLAEKAGTTGEAIIIGASVFILGAAATYSRFFPKIKSKYDYGVVIFLLTFNLITVSGYRVDNIFHMAWERLSTIAIGCGVCLIISMFVCPIWAGEDLHKSIVTKLEGLVGSLEGCMVEYFERSNRGLTDDEEEEMEETLEDKIYNGYRAILDSKTSEESLANFASWEPRHGKFRFRHPWKQYVKVGVMLRHLAYSMVALHGCLRSEIQTPPALRSALEKPCRNVSQEVTKIIMELADSIRQMKKCRASESMIQQLHLAVEELNLAFRLQPRLMFGIKRWHMDEIPDHRSMTECKVAPTVDDDDYPDRQLQGKISQEKTDQQTDRQTKPGSENLISIVMKDLNAAIVVKGDTDGEQDSISSDQRFSRKTERESARHNYMLATLTPCPSKSTYTSLEFAEALPLATFVSLLIEIVARLEYVIEAVEVLGKLASFTP